MRYTFKVSLPGKHGENYTLVASMSGICMETTEACLHGFLSWETYGKPQVGCFHIGNLHGNHRGMFPWFPILGNLRETTGWLFPCRESMWKPLCGFHKMETIWKLLMSRFPYVSIGFPNLGNLAFHPVQYFVCFPYFNMLMKLGALPRQYG